MPTVGILKFMSRTNIVGSLTFMSRINFKLSRVEHEKVLYNLESNSREITECPEDADGITNNTYSDQTAPQGHSD